MRKFLNNIIIACCTISLFLITSCSTSKKVIIRGVPGTTIHHSNLEKIGVIGADGTVKLKLDAEDKFYLSKPSNSDNGYVPFAVDIKDNWNAWDSSAGAMIGSLILSIYTLGLTTPLLYQSDKPINTSTNNDLVVVGNVKRDSTIGGNQDDVTVGTQKPQLTFYQVVAGDTLHTIAEKNGVTVEQICNINKINPTDSLQIGRMLKIR